MPTSDSHPAQPPRSPLAEPAAQPTHVYYFVLALTVCMSVLLYLDRFALSVVQPKIMDNLAIDETQMGYAIKAFFYAYALFQVPAGWIADRLGPRRALTLYVGCWSLAIVGVAASSTLTALVAARFLLGLSQAGAYPTAAGLVKKWIPPTRRGFANGSVAMGGRAGGVLSNVATPYLMIAAAGLFTLPSTSLWRPVLVLYGLIGLVWAVVFGWWFRNSPREHSRVNAAELALIEDESVAPATAALTPATLTTAVPTHVAAEATPPATPWRAIFKSANVWLLCGENLFVNIGWIFLPTWLPTYLQKVHALSERTTGWLTAATALAGMAGCVTGGWVTDRMVRRLGLRWGRRTPGLLACGGAAAAYLVCYAGQDSTVVVMAGAACAYFLSDLVLGTVWATYQDIGSRSVGVVLGIGNMCGNLAAGYFAGEIGALAKHGQWSTAMLIAAGGFACGMVCWVFIQADVPIVRQAVDESPA